MTPYEVYADCQARSAAQARAFLERFVPDRQEVADEYPLPELSQTPREVFSEAASLIERLEHERSEEYALYWDRQGSGDPHLAMLYFTGDGGMIAGLASASADRSALLRTLASVVGASYGLVVLEERPRQSVGSWDDGRRSPPVPPKEPPQE